MLEVVRSANGSLQCVGAVRINASLAMGGEQVAAAAPTQGRAAAWLHLGGLPPGAALPIGWPPATPSSAADAASQMPGFTGCMHSLKVDNVSRRILGDAVAGADVGECTSLACLSNPCHGAATCLQQGASWSCLCPAGCDDNSAFGAASPSVADPGTARSHARAVDMLVPYSRLRSISGTGIPDIIVTAVTPSIQPSVTTATSSYQLPIPVTSYPNQIPTTDAISNISLNMDVTSPSNQLLVDVTLSSNQEPEDVLLSSNQQLETVTFPSHQQPVDVKISPDQEPVVATLSNHQPVNASYPSDQPFVEVTISSNSLPMTTVPFSDQLLVQATTYSSHIPALKAFSSQIPIPHVSNLFPSDTMSSSNQLPRGYTTLPRKIPAATTTLSRQLPVNSIFSSRPLTKVPISSSTPIAQVITQPSKTQTVFAHATSTSSKSLITTLDTGSTVTYNATVTTSSPVSSSITASLSNHDIVLLQFDSTPTSNSITPNSDVQNTVSNALAEREVTNLPKTVISPEISGTELLNDNTGKSAIDKKIAPTRQKNLDLNFQSNIQHRGVVGLNYSHIHYPNRTADNARPHKLVKNSVKSHTNGDIKLTQSPPHISSVSAAPNVEVYKSGDGVLSRLLSTKSGSKSKSFYTQHANSAANRPAYELSLSHAGEKSTVNSSTTQFTVTPYTLMKSDTSLSTSPPTPINDSNSSMNTDELKNYTLSSFNFSSTTPNSSYELSFTNANTTTVFSHTMPIGEDKTNRVNPDRIEVTNSPRMFSLNVDRAQNQAANFDTKHITDVRISNVFDTLWRRRLG